MVSEGTANSWLQQQVTDLQVSDIFSATMPFNINSSYQLFDGRQHQGPALSFFSSDVHVAANYNSHRNKYMKSGFVY